MLKFCVAVTLHSKTTFHLLWFCMRQVLVLRLLDIRLLSNLVSLLRYNFSISVTLNAERDKALNLHISLYFCAKRWNLKNSLTMPIVLS